MITFLTSSSTEDLKYDFLFVPMNFIKRMFLNVKQGDKKYEQVKQLFRALSTDKVILGDTNCFVDPRFMTSPLGGDNLPTYRRAGEVIKNRKVGTLTKLALMVEAAVANLPEEHTLLIMFTLHPCDTFTPHAFAVANEHIKGVRKIKIARMLVRMGDA